MCVCVCVGWRGGVGGGGVRWAAGLCFVSCGLPSFCLATLSIKYHMSCISTVHFASVKIKVQEICFFKH